MTDKIMCVYKITNIVNGKFYIGSTNDFSRRIFDHSRKLKVGKHYNKHLQNSWNKYGSENFVFDIIFELHPYLQTCLFTIEQRFIDALKPQYNKQLVVLNGGGGLICSPETKSLISKNSKLMWKNPEYKEKARLRRLGKPLPEATKNKISKALMNNTNNLNGKAKNYIVTHPDGTKENVYNLSKFCRNNGLNKSGLFDVLSGKYKNYKGFTAERV